jgi:hypothetical protein
MEGPTRDQGRRRCRQRDEAELVRDDDKCQREVRLWARSEIRYQLTQ